MPDTITLPTPDDWHLHLRDGAMLRAVLPATAAVFARAIVMPNLVPPVTTAAMARDYARRIRAALPDTANFTPLMTCYLTDGTDPDDVAAGFAAGDWVAVKLYPAHATTNSAHGVSDVRRCDAVFERMAAIGMPLLVHGEVTDREIDMFDREALFIDHVLEPLRRRLPALKIVFEHVTTKEAVDYVVDGGDTIAATVTVQHLMLNRNALFEGGIRPHHYCLPVLKREMHRQALRQAVASGHPRFFLGTDSAPHTIATKEAACGCAGMFTAPAALPLYAQVFEEEGALDRLAAFASLNGPRFYGLPVNDGTVTLERVGMVVPERVPVADGAAVLPFRAGETVPWRVKARLTPAR